MGAVNDVGALNGLLKRIYSADGVQWSQPKNLKFSNDIEFVDTAQELGETYNQPIYLSHEGGVTYSKPDNGAFDLDDAVAGTMKNAQVDSYQAVLRSNISYEIAAKAARAAARASSTEQSKQAFRQALGVVLENMQLTLQRRREIALVNGQVNIGVVDSVASLTLTLNTKQFAPGNFSGFENSKVEVFDSAGTTQRTGTAVITGMDLVARTVTVDAVPTGTTGTDIIFFKSEHTTTTEHNFPGIHKVFTNTGTIFNISASSFGLWRSTEIDVAGDDLSFDGVGEGVARAMGKGLDEDICLYVNPRTWKNLLSDIAANRRYDATYRPADAKVGHERIEFHSQTGLIEIQSSIYVKEGFAYMFPRGRKFMRIGATDIVFRHKDRGTEYFRELDSKAGYEVRAYWNQSFFTCAPATGVIFKNIVNS